VYISWTNKEFVIICILKPRKNVTYRKMLLLNKVCYSRFVIVLTTCMYNNLKIYFMKFLWYMYKIYHNLLNRTLFFCKWRCVNYVRKITERFSLFSLITAKHKIFLNRFYSDLRSSWDFTQLWIPEERNSRLHCSRSLKNHAIPCIHVVLLNNSIWSLIYSVTLTY
jgi:hypothetical protein